MSNNDHNHNHHGNEIGQPPPAKRRHGLALRWDAERSPLFTLLSSEKLSHPSLSALLAQIYPSSGIQSEVLRWICMQLYVIYPHWDKGDTWSAQVHCSEGSYSVHDKAISDLALSFTPERNPMHLAKILHHGLSILKDLYSYYAHYG